VLLVPALTLALILRYCEWQHAGIINTDAAAFLPAWKRLLGEGTWQNAAQPSRYTTWPPLYPVLSIGASHLWGGNLELGARSVALLFGLGLVIATYELVCCVRGTMCGLVAAYLTAFCPSLVKFSVMAYPTTLYALLFTIACIVLYRTMQSTGRPSSHRTALLGACLGLAFLCRPGAVMLFAVTLAWLIWKTLRGERSPGCHQSRAAPWLPILAALGAFAIFSGPYVIAIRIQTGRWILSKSGNVRIGLQTAQADEKVRWSLNADHTDLAGTGSEGPLLSFIWAHRGEFVRKIGRNMSIILRRRLTELAPVALWVLVGAGVIARTGGAPSGLLAIASLIAPLFIIPAFVIDHVRMLGWLLPLILLFASMGVCQVGERLAASVAIGPRAAVASLTVAVALGLMLPLTVDWVSQSRTGHKFGAQYEAAGRLLRSRFGSGHRIMARKAWVPFYAGAETVQLPYASLDAMLDYARHKHVRFLVMDGITAGLRPHFAYLLNPENAPASWAVVYYARSPTGGHIVIYDLAPKPGRGR